MASSTTSPVARTTPSKVSRLIVKPEAYIKKKVPISEIGIAKTGIKVVRHCLRNTKMTNTTSAKAKKIVSSTSLIPFLILIVLSEISCVLISAGISFLNCDRRL